MRKSKRCVLPWCPACGRSIALAMSWARIAEPHGVVLIDLGADGQVAALMDDPMVDVQCGCCAVMLQVGRDVPLAAA